MFNPNFPGFPGHKRFGQEFRHGGPFGRGGGRFDEEGGGRQRQRRGDVKFVLLELIAEQPRHGYELIKALEERSAGFYRPSPGLVYPTLQLLEDEGNLASQMVDDKRIYSITDAGRVLLEQREALQNASHHGPWGRRFNAETPQLIELRRNSMALFESVMQAARYGTPEQVQAVQALLTKANQEVHSILAKSGSAD